MDHKKAIEESLDKLRDLAAKREELESQMGKLHLAVRALCNLVENRAEREAYKAVLDRYKVRTGLTDLVRDCLYTFDGAFTPVEVRNFIQNFGSEASTQPNLLQSIHTILKRLEEAREIVACTNKDGEKAYRRRTIGERLVLTSNTLAADCKTTKAIADRVEHRFWEAAIRKTSTLGTVLGAIDEIEDPITQAVKSQRKTVAQQPSGRKYRDE